MKAMWPRFKTKASSAPVPGLLSNSTVMKLHGSDNQGGIAVKTYTNST